MMSHQSIYSYMGTKIHLLLDDEVARAYNRAMVAFRTAQEEFEAKNGKKCEGKNITELRIRADKAEYEAYNAIADLINHLIAVNGGHLDIEEKQMTSAYLLKLE